MEGGQEAVRSLDKLMIVYIILKFLLVLFHYFRQYTCTWLISNTLLSLSYYILFGISSEYFDFHWFLPICTCIAPNLTIIPLALDKEDFLVFYFLIFFECSLYPQWRRVNIPLKYHFCSDISPWLAWCRA